MKEIFFFKEGSVIFWNVPELERNSVLKFLAKHAEDAYEEDIGNVTGPRVMQKITFIPSVPEPVEPKLFETWSRSRNYLFDKYLLESGLRMLG